VPTKKTTVRMSFMDQQWKPVFSLVEKGRLRRGKAAVKQLEMTKVQSDAKERRFTLRSGGFGPGVFEVTIPLFSDESAQLPRVARWFADHPQWLAACLSGQWDSDLLQTLSDADIQLFPNETIANQLKWSVRCSCQDFDSFCVHVVTALTKVMLDMDADPLVAFAWSGILKEDVLDLTHAYAREYISATAAGNLKTAWVREDRNEEAMVEATFPEPYEMNIKESGEVYQGRLIPIIQKDLFDSLLQAFHHHSS
jgi:uncharacterized Zn finger protein